MSQNQFKTVLEMDDLQRESFSNLVGKSSYLKLVLQTGQRHDENVKGLLADVNEKLFNPETSIPKVVDADLKEHKEFIDHMVTSKEYRELKQITSQNTFASALASAQLIQKIHQSEDSGKVEGSAESLRDSIRKALGEVIKVVTQTEQDIAAFDRSLGDYSGGINGSDRKFKYAEMLWNSSKMAAVAKILGRLKNIAAQKQKVRVKHGMDEIVGIEIGADLARIVPSEIAMLADPDLEDIFVVNFIENALVQYEMENVETQGKGPIVIMVDNSGSMAGEREIWSKALTFALSFIARKQKRTFGIIYFDSRVCPDFPKVYKNGKIELDEMHKLVHYFSGGGTSFEEPLAEAMKIVDTDKYLEKADLIMITDGACDVTGQFESKFSEWKKQTKSNMYTIAMCSRIPFNTPIIRMSNQSFNYLDLINDEEHVGRQVEDKILSI